MSGYTIDKNGNEDNDDDEELTCPGKAMVPARCGRRLKAGEMLCSEHRPTEKQPSAEAIVPSQDSCVDYGTTDRIERAILDAEARGRTEGVRLALKVLNDVRQGRGAMTEAGTVSLLAFHSIKEAALAEGIDL